MKKVIRWLADISGVTLEIQIEQMKDCGMRMYDAHYWWSGGMMHKDALIPVFNAFKLWAIDLRDGKYPNISTIREKVYELGDKRYGAK